MLRLRQIFIFSFLLSHFILCGQNEDNILTYSEYIENILLYHPMSEKADLQRRLAAAENLAAKGNLDPNITFIWDEKDFDEKLYFRRYQGKFKIPTQLGIDLVGGYQNSEGVFLNPENSTDPSGLWNLGIEINILQGLIVNERKVALEQAKVFQNLTENERNIALNDLLHEASNMYFQWQKYQYYELVLQENINLANIYKDNTRLSFENGEKTAMDTLEASILLQDAKNTFQKNNQNLTKSKQTIENYLWIDKMPILLQDNTLAENYQERIVKETSVENIGVLINSNPLIESYLNKKKYFEIDQTLKREKLKPKLKLKFNPLLSTTDNVLSPRFSTSDYKWGLDFSMPLLFRSERANIQKGEIKIHEIELDIESKKNELRNKIENSLLQQEILKNQIILQEQNIEGYQQLLEGENIKFDFGESSIFLLNKRQEKYIQAQLKLIDMYIKLNRELLDYLYYTNGLI